jgi:hypothetical protein
MTDFLDLLEAFHHWCVNGDRTRLERCQAWLETVGAFPRDETGWHQLGTGTVDWLTPLPTGWEPHWRMLSPRERTLTVDALEYLDTHRPGAVAAALPPSPTAAPESTALGDVPVHWSLNDVMDCVSREVQRRESQYPIQMQQGLLSAKQALQELGVEPNKGRKSFIESCKRNKIKDSMMRRQLMSCTRL